MPNNPEKVFGIVSLLVFLWRDDMVTYVPVGDSYTKGEGAEERESWPRVLTDDFRAHGVEMEMPVNPARSTAACMRRRRKLSME